MLWRLAGCPTRTSPLSVKATVDGVVLPPSAFSMTFALLPSMTATQELVVPRTMPIAFAMASSFSLQRDIYWRTRTPTPDRVTCCDSMRDAQRARGKRLARPAGRLEDFRQLP